MQCAPIHLTGLLNRSVGSKPEETGVTGRVSPWAARKNKNEGTFWGIPLLGELPEWLLPEELPNPHSWPIAFRHLGQERPYAA